MHAMSASYTTPGYGPTVPYLGNRYHDQDYDRTMPQTHNRHIQHYTSPTTLGNITAVAIQLMLGPVKMGLVTLLDLLLLLGMEHTSTKVTELVAIVSGPGARSLEDMAMALVHKGETVFRHWREEQIEGHLHRVMADGKFLQS